MKISEIKDAQGSIMLEADVVAISETKNISKFNKNLKVATATLVDESGQIQLSLWNQEIEKIKNGDRVKITNGYAKEYQGNIQLTAGKFGKIEVIGKAELKDAIPRTNAVPDKKEENANEIEASGDEDEEW